DRVLLVGMMGAGKSTVGRLLGDRLGWPYYDNDELLRRAVGIDTRTVLVRRGEAALRRAESAALTVALTEGGPLVAGVAGGVVVDPLDRARLRAGGFVVWLRASVETLIARAAGSDRPWLGDDPGAAMKALYAGRADLYLSVASYVVDVDTLPPPVVVERIIAALSLG
ncbi:MAG TPA: shikimate kinase, partial [Mycobacteriales bacterium]|nr:shikimate kinase [Mycobacteriales bacterium]